MSSSTAPLPTTEPPRRGLRLPPLVLWAGAAFGALVLVVVINAVPVSLPLAFVAGAGLVGLAMLAVGRYEAAVFLGFMFSGVVKIEPAPPDGIFAVIIAVAAVSGRLRFDRVPPPVLALLGGLTAVSVLSFAAAFSLSTGLRFVLITLYLIVFAVWLAGYADRERRGRGIVIAWLAIALISAVAGAMALQFPGFPMRLELLSNGATRASAFFKDPNVFGPFLVPIAVILLEELISPRLLRLRAATGLALFAILVIGLLYSFSRAAWANMLLSTAITLGVIVVRRRSGRRAVSVLGGLAVVALAVMALVVMSGQADFIGERAQLQSYDTERFGAQRAGVELASEYPLGIGPGQFQFYHPVETHSVYVRVLAEQGVGGLVLWAALGLVTLGFAVANVLAGRRAAGIGSAALLGSWCGLLFNGFVVDTLHWRHLWVVAALIWAATLTRQNDDRDTSTATQLRGSLAGPRSSGFRARGHAPPAAQRGVSGALSLGVGFAPE